MKKIFAFFLAAVMLLSLAACGQDVPENDEAGRNSSQQVGAPSASGNPENEGNPDIAPEDDPGAKSSQQTAEQGQINLSDGDGKADTHNGLDTADWKVEIDKGPYMENYKDIPELPNAEPNWNDAQSSTTKGMPENAIGSPDIAPEDDPNAGANQQVAQHFIVDLSEEDGSGLQSVSDTASYAGAMAGDGYIQFGDKLVEKKALSQETIEWLTWYNSLSTDEQAAISTVPADLMVASGIAKSGDSEALGTELEEKLP